MASRTGQRTKPATAEDRRVASTADARRAELAFMRGHRVTVVLTAAESALARESSFTAVYEDLIITGHVCFLRFDQQGRWRLISTAAVREIIQESGR